MSPLQVSTKPQVMVVLIDKYPIRTSQAPHPGSHESSCGDELLRSTLWALAVLRISPQELWEQVN